MFSSGENTAKTSWPTCDTRDFELNRMKAANARISIYLAGRAGGAKLN
jgi:hypothetical protein